MDMIEWLVSRPILVGAVVGLLVGVSRFAGRGVYETASVVGFVGLGYYLAGFCGQASGWVLGASAALALGADLAFAILIDARKAR